MNVTMVVNILLSFPLIMIVNLIINNNITDDKMSRYYVIALIWTILELYLEIASNYILLGQDNIHVILNNIINAVGFAVSPLVTYNLLAMQLDFEQARFKKIIAIPLLANIVICLMSIRTGWIFKVMADNSYHRGEIFVIPLTVSFFYLIICIIYVAGNSNHYNRNDKMHFTLINVAVIIAIAVQILCYNIILIWSTTSVALIMYYLILREQQFRYDDLTRVQNRFRYHKEIDDIGAKHCTLVYVDLNEFKTVNDTFGHKKGDEILVNAARLLLNSFKGIGDVFRIGGDEFCIICNKIYSKDEINGIFDKMHKITEMEQSEYIIPKLFSYGIADHDPSLQKGIQYAIEKADEAMFECKRQYKSSKETV